MTRCPSQTNHRPPHSLSRMTCFVWLSVEPSRLKSSLCHPSLPHLTSCSPAIHFIDPHSPCVLLQSGSRGPLQPIPAVARGTVRLTAWTGRQFTTIGRQQDKQPFTLTHLQTLLISQFTSAACFSDGGRKTEMVHCGEKTEQK